MQENKSNKKKIIFITLGIIVLLIAGAVGAYFMLKPKTLPADDIRPIISAMVKESKKELGGDVLSNAVADELRCALSKDAEVNYHKATQEVRISYLDIDALTADLAPEMQAKIANYVENAFDPADVYNADGSYNSKLIDNAYSSVIMARLRDIGSYVRSDYLTLDLKYSGKQWHIVDDTALREALTVKLEEKPGCAEAAGKLEYVPFHYMLNSWTGPAPLPNQASYHETTDPAEVAALFDTRPAKYLINGQKTDFTADTEIAPGTVIHYYLDETIFAITWQEEEHGALATFSEIFLGDASQLRRKIAGDIFACYEFYPPSALAAQSNAVVAVSGDYYDVVDTVHGIYAYDGKARWCNLHEGQTCFFTDKGDMLFAFENQFSSDYEVQKFMDDNGCMFSVSYGPVIVKDGVDVTPQNYMLGEINATYARACIGQMGKLHYLAMTLNVYNPDYPEYVTVKQAAESMLAHGCTQAYNLNGGQNATIVMNNKVINPVQFGYEREMSDIFYFSTALK